MRVPSALGVIQGAEDATDRQVSGRWGWLETTSEVAARGLSNPGGNSVALGRCQGAEHHPVNVNVPKLVAHPLVIVFRNLTEII